MNRLITFPIHTKTFGKIGRSDTQTRIPELRQLVNTISLMASMALLFACSGGGGGSANNVANNAATTPVPAISSPTPAGTTTSGTSGTSGQITVNASSILAPITANQIGSNMAAWFDITTPGVAGVIAATGSHLVRWPGGSTSDTYHWATNTTCDGAYVNPNSTFDNFMHDVIIPNNNEVAITINYGSNSACNGGGNPSEAAAWVAHVVANNYNVHHYTIGNEVYGDWEYDLHAIPNDPTTYANAVGSASSGGYYQLMKTQDPTAQIGVVVENNASWDNIVLSKAKYDFVELHDYIQAPGAESDNTLLTQGPASITAAVKSLRAELVAAGKSASTPILLGEFNSVYTNPGKQTLSIVNGLFAGMAFGEMLNAGVPMNTWFMNIGNGCNTGADSSAVAASLYGWQTSGTYSQASYGYAAGSCGTNSPAIPFGTLFPTGYAEQLVASFATPGNNMLATSVNTSLTNIRAYGATQGSGYALMLFNLSQTSGASITVDVNNTAKTAFNATTVTYGKAQYDNSKNNVWTAPITQSLGTVKAPLSVSVPAWSMVVLKLQ